MDFGKRATSFRVSWHGQEYGILDSFIVSSTPSHVMKKLRGMGKPEMEARHIAFQEEDRGSYLGAILCGIGGERQPGA